MAARVANRRRAVSERVRTALRTAKPYQDKIDVKGPVKKLARTVARDLALREGNLDDLDKYRLIDRNPKAQNAVRFLDALAETSAKAFYKPHGTVLVGSRLIAGNKKSLRSLVRAGIVVPIAQVLEKDGKMHWRKTTLEKANHFMVPVRDPTKMPVSYDIHGRSVFAEVNGEAYFFKGTGTGIPPVFGTSAISERINQSADLGARIEISSKTIYGGHIKDLAEYERHAAEELRGAYNRLLRRHSPALALARKYGADFFPGMRGMVVLKLEQLPVHRGKVNKTFGEREARAAKVASVVKVEKHLAYSTPPEMSIEEKREVSDMHVEAIYKVKTPFRLLNIHGVSLGRILKLYGMQVTRNGIYAIEKGTRRRLSANEAVEKAVCGFAARQALSIIILKEAKAVGSSREFDPTTTIFSLHNTTIAGENLDYDTVLLGKDAREHQNYISQNITDAMRNIENFRKNLTQKVMGNVTNPLEKARAIFVKIYAKYLTRE